MKKLFAGINTPKAQSPQAAVSLQPVPYDGSSTWGKGADKGFDAFLEAAENMEIFDIETQSEVIHRGVFIEEQPPVFTTPEQCYRWTFNKTSELLKTGKFPTFFGGNHSISIGIIDAFLRHYPGLTVVQLDAHADLRPQYDGSPYNHACALHSASQKANLIQWGVRSMDASEQPFLNRQKCFFARDIKKHPDLTQKALQLMHSPVYITIDLDVFDPAIMPATGTPEPGGLLWYEVISFLREIFENYQVAGFDITELAPIPGRRDPQFLAAKLYYKLLSYQFELKK